MPRRAARAAFASALVVLALVGSKTAREQQRLSAADRLFERMVLCADEPVMRPLAVATARSLLRTAPDSRWASEGWRVLALDGERRGDAASASRAWRGFARVFGKANVPGAALGHFNLACLDEAAGRPLQAEEGYRETVRIIRDGGCELQVWLAEESCGALARINERRRMPATAQYWNARALAFAKGVRHEHEEEP